MHTRRSTLGIAALAVSLVAVAVVQEHRLEEARARHADLALEKVNAAAANDTTRNLVIENPKVAAVAGDASVFQRQVLQVRQERDALSAALGTERIAKAGLALTIDSLRSSIVSRTGTTEDSITRVRKADFDLRQAPYTIAAAVELPAAPDTGRMDIRIALDEVPVVVRLSCAPPNTDGIRPASIDATSPPWASIKFSDVQQSPDLCRSPAIEGRAGARWRPAVLVGLGVVAPSTNEIQLGAFAGVGFRYGH